jgi:hypothetical protein
LHIVMRLLVECLSNQWHLEGETGNSPLCVGSFHHNCCRRKEEKFLRVCWVNPRVGLGNNQPKGWLFSNKKKGCWKISRSGLSRSTPFLSHLWWLQSSTILTFSPWSICSDQWTTAGIGSISFSSRLVLV